MLAATVETNRDYNLSKAPPVEERVSVMRELKAKGYKTMISIEPIIDFDFEEMIKLIRKARPHKVSIGADSKRCNLPEPCPEKIAELVVGINVFVPNIFTKKNLLRILKTK